MTVERSMADPVEGPQRPGQPRDAFVAIALYVVVLFGIPAALVVRPLGAAGTPAQIIGFSMFAWWAGSQLVRRNRPTAPNPVHWMLAVFAGAVLASYVAGMSRPISGPEVNSSDRALISLAAWCGVVLVVSEGLRSRLRAQRVIRLAAAAAAFLSVLGLLQYFFGPDLARYIKVPGLSANQAYGASLDRSGFRRVTATAGHPIEFGVVLASLLPLVMHCALYEGSRVARRRWWIVALVTGLALPMSVARSAFIGAGLALMVMYPTWPRRARRKILVAAVVGAAALSVVVPGLLGTIRSLFLNVNSDPSTQGRKNDYGPVLEYFQQNPLSGRGIGTFVPEIYRTLDNQYLGLLVETGLLGTLAFLTLLLGAIVTAVMVRRASTDARTRDLAQCLIAGIVVIGVNSATFDTFGFAMCTGTLTLMIGLIGWLWADQRRSQGAPTFEPERRSTSRPLVVITVSALLVSWVVGGVAVVQSKTKTEWRSIASLVPVTGQTSGTGAYFATPRASLTVSLLHDTLDDRAVRDKVEKLATGNYEVAVGDGSLAMGTDRIGYGPILWISAEARTPDESHALLEIVADEADRRLLQWQTSQGTLPELITTQRNVEAPYPVAGRRSRALGGFAMLSFILVAMGLTLRRERRLRVRAPGVGPAALEAVSS